MTVISPAELRAAMRSDFYLFLTRCFGELLPVETFRPNWHIEVLAAKLQSCREGRCRRLIINVPPRSLKSLAASVALPAWWLGHDPAAGIISVTYGQDLSDKMARDCRAVMASAWYQAMFPTRLSSARPALNELTTTANGYRLATSVGGVLTGRGGDVIIVDDPLKPDEAMSELRRKAVNDWYDGTLLSRLNDKQNGTIIVIMQRLHEDDLVGHILEQEGWQVVRFPAIAEADEEHVIEVMGRRRVVTRREGEALSPLREPLSTLETLRRSMGAYNFAGQYQQNPAPARGGLVEAAWFGRYTADQRPAAFDQIVQSWDTANKESELADYSVCTTWGIVGEHRYLLHVFRKKLGFPDLKRSVVELRRLFDPSVILIEDKASGTQLIQELVAADLSIVQGVKSEYDKVMRFHAQTATIENGFVHLPADAAWVDDYLHELMRFPRGRNDDQVDSTSQALAWLKRPTTTGIIDYYRQQCALQNGTGSRASLRLKAPVGVTTVYTATGEMLTVHNGHLTLLEADARPLIANGWTLDEPT